jgi:hypothetical protein
VSGAAHFLIFDCSCCGKRIFGDRNHLGLSGKCPLCGKETVIGGTASAPLSPTSSSTTTTDDGSSTSETDSPSASERRRSRRVPLANARLGYESRATAGRPVSPEDLAWIDDISETGLGFSLRGEPDKKKLAGFAPPPSIKVGEQITVTLHVPELFRPRTLKAVVRRIVPQKKAKDLFRVGAEFVAPSDEAKADLRKLLEKR